MTFSQTRRKRPLKSALGQGLIGGRLRPSFEGIGIATSLKECHQLLTDGLRPSFEGIGIATR